MLLVEIEISDPSKYVSDAKVDEIALAYNQAYRERGQNKAGFPVDMERFVDLLEVSMLWEEIEEPYEAVFLASYTPDNGGLITINERHRRLFEERPDVYSSCLGHEVGHRVLRHHEHSAFSSEPPSLFSELAVVQRVFHKSSWSQYGLTKEEVMKRKLMEQEIAKKAIVSEQARQILAQLHNRFEPEWMFWQAEHFSLCLQVPKDRLLELLEDGWDYASWRGIYRLGEHFVVSGSMMRRRLTKLKLIKVGDDGQPHAIQQTSQENLFN